MPTRKPAKVSKRKCRRDSPKGKAWGKPIDVCGQTYVAKVFEELILEGGCVLDDNEISVRRAALDRMEVTLVHELLHAILDASEMGWQIRSELGLTRKQWEKFEEDFIVRPLAPALYATLKRAGMLVIPKLPSPTRHRRA